MMALVGAWPTSSRWCCRSWRSETFAGDARTYGFLTAAMGLGAVVGGLVRGRVGAHRHAALVVASGLFGLAMLLAAAAPTLPLALVALALVGACSVAFLVDGQQHAAAAPTPRCAAG